MDRRTDVYALGVIAYRMATGRLPFVWPSVARMLLAHLHDVPRPPRELNPQIPEEFERAILRALAKSPGDRFQSMEAFGEALAQALGAASGPSTGRVLGSDPTALALTRAEREEAQRPAPPPPPAPPALPLAEVELEDGTRLSGLRVLHLTREAAFVCAEQGSPPLFSRVRVYLGAPGAAVAGEVIRHVPREQASSWNGEPGFAVQFVGVRAEERAAIERLLEAGGSRR